MKKLEEYLSLSDKNNSELRSSFIAFKKKESSKKNKYIMILLEDINKASKKYYKGSYEFSISDKINLDEIDNFRISEKRKEKLKELLLLANNKFEDFKLCLEKCKGE